MIREGEGLGSESPRVQYHGTWGYGYDEDEWLERRRISMVRRQVELVLGGGRMDGDFEGSYHDGNA